MTRLWMVRLLSLHLHNDCLPRSNRCDRCLSGYVSIELRTSILVYSACLQPGRSRRRTGSSRSMLCHARFQHTNTDIFDFCSNYRPGDEVCIHLSPACEYSQVFQIFLFGFSRVSQPVIHSVQLAHVCGRVHIPPGW